MNLWVRSKAGLPRRWEGRLVLSFRRTAWFGDGSDGLVGLVTEGVSPSPCGLELWGPLPVLRPGAELRAQGDDWNLGDAPLLGVAAAPDVTAIVEAAPQGRTSAARVRRWLAWFDAFLPTDAEGRWLQSLEPGPGTEWESLVGRGSGSTPLGDDYLAGWSAARRRRGLWTPDDTGRLRRVLPRTTRLSRHYLSHLTEGRVDAALARFLAAPGLVDPESPEALTLADHGDRSGLGTLVGLVAGLTAEETAGE
jgi:hypothetical protein